MLWRSHKLQNITIIISIFKCGWVYAARQTFAHVKILCFN